MGDDIKGVNRDDGMLVKVQTLHDNDKRGLIGGHWIPPRPDTS